MHTGDCVFNSYYLIYDITITSIKFSFTACHPYQENVVPDNFKSSNHVITMCPGLITCLQAWIFLSEANTSLYNSFIQNTPPRIHFSSHITAFHSGCTTAGSDFIRRHYMCHTGYSSHPWITILCITRVSIMFMGMKICPSKATTTLVGCIHAYFHVVHPGIILPDRVMLNGMI